MANDLRWFPFDPTRMLRTREARRALKGRAVERAGILLLLLVEQWEHGPIPDDDEWLSEICPDVPLEDVRSVLQACFNHSKGGSSSARTWIHEELEEVRAEKEERSAWYRERASKGGRARAEKLRNQANSAASSTPEASYKPASDVLEPARRGEEKREEVVTPHPLTNSEGVQGEPIGSSFKHASSMTHEYGVPVFDVRPTDQAVGVRLDPFLEQQADLAIQHGALLPHERPKAIQQAHAVAQRYLGPDGRFDLANEAAFFRVLQPLGILPA